jgi:hypothetical protein
MSIWNILWPFGIFYGHLEYFMAIWNILWPFGNFVVILDIFPRFGILCQEKSGNPGLINSRRLPITETLAFLCVRAINVFQEKKKSFGLSFL